MRVWSSYRSSTPRRGRRWMTGRRLALVAMAMAMATLTTLTTLTTLLGGAMPGAAVAGESTTLPGELVAVVQTPSYGEVLQRVGQTATALLKGTKLEKQVQPAMLPMLAQMMIGLPPAFLSGKEDLRLVISARPNAGEEFTVGLAFSIPAFAEELKRAQAMGIVVQEGADGVVQARVQKRAFFFKAIGGDRVVLGPDAASASHIAAQLTAPLPPLTPHGSKKPLLRVLVDIAKIRARQGDQIEALYAQIRADRDAEIAKGDGSEADRVFKTVFYDGLIHAYQALIEVEATRLDLDLGPEGLRIDLRGRPAPGSSLAEFTGAYEGMTEETKDMGLVPGEATLFCRLRLPESAQTALLNGIEKITSALMMESETAEQRRFVQLIRGTFESFAGQSVGGLMDVGGELMLVGGTRVNDPVRAKRLLPDWVNFAKPILVRELKPGAQEVLIALSAEPEAGTINGVPYGTAKLDFEVDKAYWQANPNSAKKRKTKIGVDLANHHMQMAYAVQEDLLLTATGPAGAAGLEAAMAGRAAEPILDSPAMRTYQRARHKQILFVGMNQTGFLKAFFATFTEALKADAESDPESANALRLARKLTDRGDMSYWAMGVSDPNPLGTRDLTTEIWVPMDTLNEIAKVSQEMDQ